ncbi:MAG: tetratricopeptide repeat protein [Chloroflexi bacterium]|nr:tetratricopeptide repeat protein [Chloroflexota bacterium]MCL5074037.1 tetratricopeptide repeat protein [Chloroflexota bacterium]
MTQFQSESRDRLKKRWIEQAISLAMQNRWEDAVAINRTILDLFPNDVDAYNRLGRALTELGRYREAREAYQRAVEIDPNNTIAQKNLSRLSQLTIDQLPAKEPGKVIPHMFMAESGKTGVVTLTHLADSETLAKVAVGEEVHLTPRGRALLVYSVRDEYLGQVEPHLSQRLIDLMRGGNRYAAALMALGDGRVDIIIREIYQDPSQIGKISFPSKVTPESTIRPYIKDTLLKYEFEEEEFEEPELGLETESEPEELEEGDLNEEQNSE